MVKKIKKILCWMIVIFLTNIVSAYAGEMQIWTVSEPPGNFVDEHGKITGLSVDFVREIQRRIVNTDDIKMIPWQRIYNTALKKPNIVFFSVARTPEREDKFHWITLVMRKPWAFYKRKDSALQIKSLEDAKQVNAVGIVRGGVRENWLRQQGFTNLDEAKSHKQTIEKLFRKRLDLILYSPHGVSHVCRTLGLDINKIEPVLFPYASVSYIAMSKKGTPPETAKLWQKTAKEIKDDGSFAKLAQKWMIYSKEKDGIEAEVKDGALNFWKQ